MITIGMSTSSVYPLTLEDAFRLGAEVGFDGIEVMVTRDEATRDPAALTELAERYSLPVLSIHAPVLLLTHFVWGRDPYVKLEKSARLAAELGAGRVVVHPPFRWQASYAQNFTESVRTISAETGVEIGVENMFTWRAAGRELAAYAPDWNPAEMDCDAAVLDFSHAALSGIDSLELARTLGPRLRHVHLCDGSGRVDENRIFDEHLIPGHGRQPVASVLNLLAHQKWDGTIVAEVNTRKSKSETQRLELLAETLGFARVHTNLAKTPKRTQGHLDRLIVETTSSPL